jgi:hypothetical protein
MYIWGSKLYKMMKNIFFSISLMISFISSTYAEEGMLIPSLITAFESEMQAMGMKLSAKDIYDANHSSIKDAIIHFGGGCTAELVSSQGLILTNHHCGYSQIQSHSSLEKDYLKYGFWAKNKEEELANAGLTATRMVRIEDVTASVLFGINPSDDAAKRASEMKKNIEQLIKDATLGNHYEAEIKPFNYGNDFYLLVKEVFKDVRLVGTPPNSIGKFGGDTDNWVWPRHTGDFSVFRIYAGKDNKPAVYSKENVPYTPIHFLPISFTNRKVGDFTMVYGFPGTTEQHLVSGQIKYIIEKERPARILMREKSLSVIDAAMRSSDEVRIKYSAKQASIANAYKKWIGQIGGLNELDAVEVKKKYEAKYLEMANSNPEWKAKYATTIDAMNKLVADKSLSDFNYVMGVEYIYVGPEVFDLAEAINDLVLNYKELVEKKELQAKLEALKKGAEGFFKNYDANVDKGIFELLTDEYTKQTTSNASYSSKELTELIYKKSILTNKDRYLAFLNGFKEKSLKKLEKDPAFAHWKAIVSNFQLNVIPQAKAFNGKMTELLKIYVEGKKVMFPNDQHWPDANSTLRITYGKLEGSAPTDGMAYTEHTTTKGILQKHQTGNPDFALLPKMVEMYEKKDFGEYAQDGELWVCFTGSNHTTGGNSGSPVLDANGYLMGLNFDRTWESTMSDYMFDPNRCRNVVVDIRYVLWVMDKFSGAKHLVDEMKLMR